MDDGYRWQSWIVAQWSRVALPCAIIILALLPVLADAENWPIVLVVTLLPVYMIHQYEEHAHGGFYAFFNAVLGGGREVLSLRDIYWVNILGVWLAFLVSYWLARFIDLDFALIPVYLTLVNAVTHVVVSLKLHRYNPGLWTALVLFIPWGSYLLVYFNNLTAPGVAVNIGALLVAVVMHAIILAFVWRKRASVLSQGDQAPSGVASTSVGGQ